MAAKITLAQAQAVIRKHNDAEWRAKREAAMPFVGKYFKYHNSYGHGKKWWLYFAATGVESFAACKGWSFQHTGDDRIEIRLAEHAHVQNGGYTEITSGAFWKAFRAIQAKVAKRGRKQVRRRADGSR